MAANRLFTHHSCVECGIHFGMPDDYYVSARRNPRWFYCPNNHGQRYTTAWSGTGDPNNTRRAAPYDSVLCTECGLECGIDPEYHALRKKDAKPLYCLNGHKVEGYEKPDTLVRLGKEVKARVKAEQQLIETQQALAAATERVKKLEAQRCCDCIICRIFGQRHRGITWKVEELGHGLTPEAYQEALAELEALRSLDDPVPMVMQEEAQLLKLRTR